MRLTTFALSGWVLLLVSCAAGAPVVEHAAPAADLEASLRTTLDAFANRLEQDVLRVALGNVTYEDLGVGSPLGAYLRDRMSLAIGESPRIEQYERDNMGQLVAELKLGSSELVDPSTSASLGRLAGVHAILEGRYYLDNDAVEVAWVLTEIETARKHTARSVVARTQLPSTIDFAPPNLATFRAQQAALGDTPAGDFAVELWVDRGQGGVYRDGEQAVVYFRAARECYLKLVHVAVDGEMTLIFPNKFSTDNRVEPGRLYSLGGEGYAFRFALHEPFGVETIRAFASTDQFSDIQDVLGQADQTVLVSLGKANADTVRAFRTRGLSVIAASTAPSTSAAPKYPSLAATKLTSEAQVTYTIVAK